MPSKNNIHRHQLYWLLVLMFFIATAAHSGAAAAATLTWDANTETNLVGYRLYYGTSSGNYTASINVGNLTSTTIENLQSGTTYYFAVTAFNSDNLESQPSNEATFTLPPEPADPPAVTASARLANGSFQFTIKGQVGQSLNIYYSSDLQEWTPMTSVVNSTGTLVVTDPDASTVDRRFYRVIVE